jgi:phage tail-like protein
MPDTDTLLHQLPAIYQDPDRNWFLIKVLAAIEKLLLGRADGPPTTARSLEESIARLPLYFDPAQTDAGFLDWLAGWVGVTLQAELTEEKRREIIGRIVPLYRIRGTRRGLEEIVKLFTDGEIAIRELDDIGFQLRDHSTIAKDTYLGGPFPHVFEVVFTLPAVEAASPEEQQRRERSIVEIARATIEMSKPAHTHYTMRVKRPGGRNEPSH